MRKVFVLLLVVMVFVQCESDPREDCSVPATVRDLTGLDGCGWVFELQDSTRLEPFFGLPRCGFGEMDEKSENPLSDFEFVDGKRVFIDYEIVQDHVSICMVGPIVKITCISEAATISEE